MVKIVLGTLILGLEQVQDEQLHKEEVLFVLSSLILLSYLVYVSETLYTIKSETFWYKKRSKNCINKQ